MTLPIHQRKGYGNLLIDFSYLLTRVEKKTGSPEKPLSDMGLVSYRNYWRLVMCRYLLDHVSDDKMARSGLSIRQISDDTGLTPDDVISALEGLRCLVREPQTELYAFRADLEYCREYVSKWEAKNYVTLKPAALTWTPYVMGRSNATNFELGPALTAIAPREEDDETKTAQLETAVPPSGDSSAAVTVVEANGVEEVPQEEPESIAVVPIPTVTVVESTEPIKTEASPTEGVPSAGDSEVLVNGEAAQVNGSEAGGASATAESSVDQADEDWTSQYKDVLPTKFVVYPPLSARRLDRPRPQTVRPSASRTGSASRSRPRRPSSSVRRSSGSRPKNSSSRRRVGGTGRGPGRWPKGTKKSDYGNADSGPGLPPAWIAERARQAVPTPLKKEDDVSMGDEAASE